MPYLEYRVVARVVEPAAKLPAIQRTQAMIEDAPVPMRRAAADRRFGVRMKTRYCAPSFLRSRIDEHGNQDEIAPLPIAQHPAILVPLPAATVYVT